MKGILHLSLILVFNCCLAIIGVAQLTPETSMDRPEIETIIGLQMPGGNDIMSTVNVVASDVDNSHSAIEINDENIVEQPQGDVIDNSSANVNGDNPIDIEDEIDKEELIIRESASAAFDKKLTLYPNPANNFINMEMEENGIYKVEIFNLIGSLVYSSNAEIGKANSLQVDLQQYHTGIYILHISNNSTHITKKFAIKR